MKKPILILAAVWAVGILVTWTAVEWLHKPEVIENRRAAQGLIAPEEGPQAELTALTD